MRREPTAAEREKAKDAAVAAILANDAMDIKPVNTAVTEAVTTYDVSHSLIAAEARINGLLIASMIKDHAARRHAFAMERNAAERQRERVRETMRDEAIRAVANGADKSALASQLHVSRPTLYTWLQEKPTPFYGRALTREEIES